MRDRIFRREFCRAPKGRNRAWIIACRFKHCPELDVNISHVGVQLNGLTKLGSIGGCAAKREVG